MAIFNSYVSLPEGIPKENGWFYTPMDGLDKPSPIWMDQTSGTLVNTHDVCPQKNDICQPMMVIT
jgi:hypothetical protein